MQHKLKDMNYSHIASAASCSNSDDAQKIIALHTRPDQTILSFTSVSGKSP